MSKIYEIDPDADTLVIVRPLQEDFAPWPVDEKKKTATQQTNGHVNGHSLTNGASPAEVRIKVSSKHLSLASPHFRDRFAWRLAGRSGGYNGGKHGNDEDAVHADGRVHVVLDGLDAAAVIAVFNIVHGRGGRDRVPKAVDLEALARIAVVVDRFRLQDAVELYAERWIDDLYRRRGVTSPSSTAGRAAGSQQRDLALWIYVAYVFQRADIFREATKVAATQSTGPLPALPNLPLRAKIVHDVDAQRQAVIAQALDLLQAAVDQLVAASDESEDARGGGVTNTSDTNTDAFLLGTLLRTLHRNRLFWPRPNAPYVGVSVAAITRAAHEVQTQVWRLAARVGDTTRSNRTNNKLLLTPQLDTLRASIAGLDLTSELGYPLY
ncbi:glutathione s-transferase [Niveomyces insectorum RCEF 264]|uniref:Glutathione s-transferase n=1 Tax=Niveomyces insectorum RCEF 264 TaxID=1081102 RepID=A0A167UPN9_9HYPO|nr:glutathione s-transferase [Niveomyces insectorum RCEF 264]